MARITLTLCAHLADVLRPYSVFDNDHTYFDSYKTREACTHFVQHSILPTNRILLSLMRNGSGGFRANLCISGILCELMERFSPAGLDSFRELLGTGNVELLGSPYHHGLAFLYAPQEFTDQIQLQTRRMKTMFGQTPAVFCNTHLIHNDRIAAQLGELGFTAILCDGWQATQAGLSCNRITSSSTGMPLILRNPGFSDDLQERFSDRTWPRWPLTAPKYADWLADAARDADVINLVWDYATFGLRHALESGIFEFLAHMPEKVLDTGLLEFAACSEAVAAGPAVGDCQVEAYKSPQELGGDLSSWLATPMQSHAAARLFSMAEKVRCHGDPRILDDWRRLQPTDHLAAMGVNHENRTHSAILADRLRGSHGYDAYINFMNTLDDVARRLE